MKYVNPYHISIPRLQELLASEFDDNWNLGQLDMGINAPATNFKLIHPLLISRHAAMRTHHSDTPIKLIGLDIETQYQTGEPRLLGYTFQDGYYRADESPSLESLFETVHNVSRNDETHFAVWGNLDIQCIIRLFDPTESERERLSRGISGIFKNGEWEIEPPVKRLVGVGLEFVISHYIPGRSLRLGIRRGKWLTTVWVFNISQFFNATIAETAKARKLGWVDYPTDTHKIDWMRYGSESEYRTQCLSSNAQDSRIVKGLGEYLQSSFYEVFKAYPSLLVSTGSLADAAVSSMLTESEYLSCSWNYLAETTFKDTPNLRYVEGLISQGYSAGYVDQYAVGYAPEAYTADISSAYPHKIRELPDLSNFEIFTGKEKLQHEIRRLESIGYRVFTAIVKGFVYIPEHLRYHPITIRNSQRQNVRQIGYFPAVYYLEERDFCVKLGARFQHEEYAIFATKEWKESAIARVSKTLGELRDNYRKRVISSQNESEKIFNDSMQEIVKIIDNSLYGKTVMTTAITEDTDSGPKITSYKTGDRTNFLYGGIITARTRCQLADACMSVAEAGGRPALNMTDAVYWIGRRDMLPQRLIANEKTAGMFEPPEKVEEFFLLKTGQYEYRKKGEYFHKLRGLNVGREDRATSQSFYRRVIKEWMRHKPRGLHPEEVVIPLTTRRLVTVGAGDLDSLGLVQDANTTELRPYILSSKESQPYLLEWESTIDSMVWLKPVSVSHTVPLPLDTLTELYVNGDEKLTHDERLRIFYLTIVKFTGKWNYYRELGKERLADCSFQLLEDWSGVKYEWLKLEQ